MPRASASARVAERRAGGPPRRLPAHLARTGRGTANAGGQRPALPAPLARAPGLGSSASRPASVRGPEHEVLPHLLDRLGPRPPRLRLSRLAESWRASGERSSDRRSKRT